MAPRQSHRFITKTLGNAPLAMAGLFSGLWLAMAPSAAEAAPAQKLIGKWQAEAMEVDGKRHPVKPPMRIVFEFQKGGQFHVTIQLKDESEREEGTFKVTGQKVTMTAAGKTEEMTYTITGAKLRMEKTMGGKTMLYFMMRIP